MIIDTHVHVWDGGWYPESEPGMSAPEMLETMDEYGIEQSWISTLTGFIRDYREYNKRLYEFCKTDENKLYGFYTVNANTPDTMMDELKRCVEEYGAKGIKLHSWLQGFSVCYPQMDRIAEGCVQYNLPIMFHDGTPPYSDTCQIIDLAERHPQLRVILGHAGLYDSTRAAILGANRYDNVYLCLCAPTCYDIATIVREVKDKSKLIAGSDSGGKDKAVLYNRMDVVKYGIEMGDPSLMDDIMYYNAKNFFSTK